MPKLHSASIIGYTRKGVPIREIRGASESQVEQGQQQDSGDIGDLLDDDTPDQQQGDQEQGEQPPGWWQTAQAQIIAQTNSQIDRRINQLIQNRKVQQPPPSNQSAAQQQSGSAAGPDRGDFLYARSVARDTLNDSGVRLSPAERDLANTIMPGAIRAAMDTNSDPDAVGDQVGRAVGEAIKKLRTEHQTSIISQLEKRGALDRSKLKPGQQQQASTNQTAPKSTNDQWKAGADKAAELAQRMGRKVPGQTN